MDRRVVGRVFTVNAVARRLGRYGVERTTVSRLCAYRQRNCEADRACARCERRRIVAGAVAPSPGGRHTHRSGLRRRGPIPVERVSAHEQTVAGGSAVASGGTREASVSEVSPVESPVVPDEPRTRTSHRRAIDVGDAGARTRQARRTETAVRNTALWVSAVTTTRPVRAETLPAVTATRRRGFVDLVS